MISRAEAKLRGLKRYNTGKPCKHGHLDERLVSNFCCLTCHNLKRNAQRAKSDKHKETYKKWYGNRDLNQVAKDAETQRLYVARKRRPDREYITGWTDWDATNKVYMEALSQGKTVDHIIPLGSDTVCGLHVGDNLQILSKFENCRKLTNYESKL